MTPKGRLSIIFLFIPDRSFINFDLDVHTINEYVFNLEDIMETRYTLEDWDG